MVAAECQLKIYHPTQLQVALNRIWVHSKLTAYLVNGFG